MDDKDNGNRIGWGTILFISALLSIIEGRNTLARFSHIIGHEHREHGIAPSTTFGEWISGHNDSDNCNIEQVDNVLPNPPPAN